MNKRRVIVIGGSAAGPSAAAKAKRTNPNTEITMFEATGTISYGICETPYAISGLIEDEGKLVIYTPDRFHEEKGIDVKTLHRVEKIFTTKHCAVVRDLRRRSTLEYKYDKLILATGARPRKLNIGGEDSRNVFHLRGREDTLNIKNYLASESPAKAVIIGGGYIGMEMCEALSERGLDVTLIHCHRLPLRGLELQTRERLLEELQHNGIRFVSNADTEQFQQDSSGRVRHVVTSRGSFVGDIVILAVGVEPNIELAKSAKIRIGSEGGIITDERQQTSADGIYAVGDCCEVKNLVTGKNMYLPLATIASRTAWVAGENAAGGRATFKGAIGAKALKVFGLEVARVGIGSDEAKKHGFRIITEEITANSSVNIMPGSQKITIRMIIDERSRRLLGANVYGGKGAVMRANTLGVAIQHKMTIDDISRFDLIYAPPFAPLWDPILIAANQSKKKL